MGDNFAQSVVSSLGLDPRLRLGTLSDSQLKELEKALTDGSSLKVPQWAFNRRRDPETGETKQLVGSDLDIANKTRHGQREDRPELEGRQARSRTQGERTEDPHDRTGTVAQSA